MFDLRPIHPFPARMAPEILQDKLAAIGRVSSLWDPMCGSGTSLRIAAAKGIPCFGSDTDPLALKMASVGTRNYATDELIGHIEEMEHRITRVADTPNRADECAETRLFKEFWFSEPQRSDLYKIAHEIKKIYSSDVREFFEIALSRIIITKFRGASLAWDVSHSRPHRKKTENNFDVTSEFVLSCRRLAELCGETPHYANVSVERADARHFQPSVKPDLVVTSPPYLNAIDYMRGHKMALVWMGWTIPQLRALRSDAIGAERQLLEKHNTDLLIEIERASVVSSTNAANRIRLIIRRYIQDCVSLIHNITNNLANGGNLIFVVADSHVRGHKVRSDSLFRTLAIESGLQLVDTSERLIPANRRYLPAHTDVGIGNRMKREWILHFAK